MVAGSSETTPRHKSAVELFHTHGAPSYRWLHFSDLLSHLQNGKRSGSFPRHLGW